MKTSVRTVVNSTRIISAPIITDSDLQAKMYRPTPVQVGNATDWKEITSGGYQSSAAIKTGGTLWTWGQNSFGQLGDGTNVARNYPVAVDSNCPEMSVTEAPAGIIGSVYPNPAVATIHIITQGRIWSVTLLDASGRLVGIPLFRENMVDVSGLRPGVYFVQVVTDSGSFTEKMVKK